MDDFNSSQPIFVQIRDRIIKLILVGAVAEGDALPSVRQISADMSVNPLTVTKAFEGLVDSGIVEKRRGLGMYVQHGARDKLLAQEREKFLKDEWPRILAQIKALDLDLKGLLEQGQTK